MKRLCSSAPSVYGTEWFDSTRLVSSTPNPTSTISFPVRFCGRRDQPINPATTNEPLTNSSSAVDSAGCFSWSLVSVSATAIAPAINATGPRMSQRRRVEVTP